MNKKKIIPFIVTVLAGLVVGALISYIFFPVGYKNNIGYGFNIIIFGLLICCLLYFLYYIQSIRKEKKHEKAVNSILAFNKKIDNILLKLDDPREKLKALQMTIESIEKHEEYNRNLEWKYSLLISIYVRITDIYDMLGDEEKMMEIYNRILELNSRHAISYFKRSLIYYNRGDYANALEDINKAIKYNSYLPVEDLYTKRGLIYDKIGDYQNAVDDYSHALQVYKSSSRTNFDLSNTFFNRAKAYVCMNKYSEAINDYQKYLESDPENKEHLKLEAENAINELQKKI